MEHTSLKKRISKSLKEEHTHHTFEVWMWHEPDMGSLYHTM